MLRPLTLQSESLARVLNLPAALVVSHVKHRLVVDLGQKEEDEKRLSVEPTEIR